MTLLAQLPPPPTGAIESWLLSAAAVASMALLARKLFLRKPPGDADFVTKTEFHHELAALRDKIDARFLTLLEKLTETKAELLLRLNELESNFARVDERTKK